MLALNKNTLKWHEVPECEKCHSSMFPRDIEFKTWACLTCQEQDESRQSDQVEERMKETQASSLRNML